MTRQKWTTEAEFEWLKQHIPAFLEAQENNTTQTFFNGVYEGWGNHFQVPPPTQGEINKAKGDVEVATLKKRKAVENCLFRWFHNNTRAGALAVKDLIPIQKTTKTPAVWQAYQTLYYEKKLKAIIDAEYSAYLNANGEKEVNPKTRFRIQGEIARREYEAETPEVKAEVDKYRTALKNGKSKILTDEIRSQHYQMNIDRLSKSLAHYMKSFEDATGWSFCVLAGGPIPRQEGKINTMIYNTEAENNNTPMFETTVGAKEWESMILKWDEYLFATYPEDIRKKLTLSSKSPTPGSDKEEDSEERDVDDDDGEDESGIVAVTSATLANKAKAQSTSTSSAPKNKSEYEIRKEQNIAKNKQLFKEVFGDNVWGDDGPGSSKGKIKKLKKKGGSSSIPESTSTSGRQIDDNNLNISTPAMSNGGEDQMQVDKLGNGLAPATAGEIDTLGGNILNNSTTISNASQ